jgi:hypothetical protein
MTDPQRSTAPIDFYFDFSSPYGYFAAEKIDDLAARYGRTVLWHPFLLGVTFKVTGLGPLPGIPLKGAYSLHDIARSARYFGLPFRQPSVFPIPTTSSCGPNNSQPWCLPGSVEKTCADAALPSDVSSIVPPYQSMSAASATAATLRVRSKPPCFATFNEKTCDAFCFDNMSAS